MKLTFNDLERIIRMLENIAHESHEPSQFHANRRKDLAIVVQILRNGYCREIPESKSEKSMEEII